MKERSTEKNKSERKSSERLKEQSSLEGRKYTAKKNPKNPLREKERTK